MKKTTTSRRVRQSAAETLWAPTPPQIEKTPELASLAVLGFALEMATSALVVAYPEFCDLEPREPLTATAIQAAKVIESARRLGADLAGYRSAIEKEQRAQAQSTDDDIPF